MIIYKTSVFIVFKEVIVLKTANIDHSNKNLLKTLKKAETRVGHF